MTQPRRRAFRSFTREPDPGTDRGRVDDGWGPGARPEAVPSHEERTMRIPRGTTMLVGALGLGLAGPLALDAQEPGQRPGHQAMRQQQHVQRIAGEPGVQQDEELRRQMERLRERFQNMSEETEQSLQDMERLRDQLRDRLREGERMAEDNGR